MSKKNLVLMFAAVFAIGSAALPVAAFAGCTEATGNLEKKLQGEAPKADTEAKKSTATAAETKAPAPATGN